MRICPDCHKVVPALDAVEIGGKYYHKSCRICYKCGKVINDDFLHPKQEFEGHSYHFSCLHAAQTCCICGKVTHRYGRISSSRSRYSCEISIHENLPYLVFKGVLAHELLHSWIALYAIKLPDNEEEGLCNLGKFLILKQEKSKEADYLIQWALEENKAPGHIDL